MFSAKIWAENVLLFKKKIMVHAFNINDKYIIYDSEGGNVFTADMLVYLLINGGDVSEYPQRQIEEAKEEIEHLKQQGLIYVQAVNARGIDYDGKIKSVCLHICHDCNMRCAYCFGGGGSYNGGRAYMDERTAKRAVDFLIEKSGGIKNLEMDFFGGEPLLNIDVLKKTVEYARKREKECGKVFKFTATTNGILLNEENSRYLNENMDNVVISIDGRKSVNDNVRKSAGGGSAYDDIMANAKYFRSIRGDADYYIRGTYTAKNIDFCDDVLFLNDCGFDQISIEPVVLDHDNPLSIKEEHLEQISRQYKKLASEYIKRRKGGKWFNFFHFMIDLEGGACIKKRLTGCGAGGHYIAVSPEGDIYPCHQFVGRKEYYMGNVFEESIDKSISEKFINSDLLTKQQCQNCFAKYFCSGGCAANNIFYGGGIDSPHYIYCQIMKTRFECALYIYAMEHEA